MADVVRRIEITAALSPDYQSAFKAAAGIAKDTSAQISALTKRELDLQKLLALDAQRAAAAQSGNAKEAGKASSAYDKLAQKLGVVGQSAEQLQTELKGIGERRVDLEKLNKSASKQAALGQAAADVKRLSEAYKRFKDPALLKALEQSKQKFARLGGVMPKEKQLKAFSGFGAKLQAIPGPVGQVARSFAGLKSVLSGPAGVVAGISALAAASVGAAKKLWDMGVSAVKSGDKIIKTADALGISTDAYQELSYAMQRGGASAEDFDAALKHVEQQMGAAVQGQSKAVKAFSQFGITVKDIESMNAEEAFYAIADGISKIEDPSKRMKASLQLLGGSGEKVAHAMRGGAAGLDELRKAAKATGNVRSRKELEQSAKAADMLLDAQLSLKGAFNDVAYEVMPTVIGVLKDLAGWVRENREGIRRFAETAGTFMRGFAKVVSVAFSGISAGIKIVAEGIAFWQDKFAAFCEWISGVFTGVKDAIVGAFKAAFDWISSVIDGIIDRFRKVKEWVTGEDEEYAPVITSATPEERAAARAARARQQQIQVNVNVDARGGDSATGAAVQRALSKSQSATTGGIERALNQYGALAEGA